jgi:hypothetical protein
VDGCRGRMSDFDFDLMGGYKLLRKGQLSGWGKGIHKTRRNQFTERERERDVTLFGINIGNK